MSDKSEATVVDAVEVDFELDFMMTDPPARAGIHYEEVDPAVLADIDYFQDIDPASIEALLKGCRIVVIEAQHTLLDTGQLNLRMYFLLDGQLQIFREESGDKPVGIVDIGQAVGVLSAVDRKPGTETVVASEDSRLLAIDINTMFKLAQQLHPLACRFSELLVECWRGENYVPLDKYLPRLNRRRVSYVDELTGLHNNRWLQRILPRHINRSSTNQSSLSIVMLAIDGFDGFKQDFGETIADHALRTAAHMIMENARPTDMLAYLEENCFVVVLPDTNLAGAAVLAQRLTETAAETQIVIPNECALPPVTLSIGITQLDRHCAAETLLEEARQALGDARAKGGNWVAASASEKN